jgi:hypothetical protein
MPEVAEWYDRAANTNETIEITELLDLPVTQPTEPRDGD